MRCIMRKIVAGEGDQFGDLSTVAEPSVVDVIKKRLRRVHRCDNEKHTSVRDCCCTIDVLFRFDFLYTLRD
jgi:hypothetical protein